MDQDEYNRALELEFEKGQAFARGLLDVLRGTGLALKATHDEATDVITLSLVI